MRERTVDRAQSTVIATLELLTSAAADLASVTPPGLAEKAERPGTSRTTSITVIVARCAAVPQEETRSLR
jgi:hypothetical protein